MAKHHGIKNRIKAKTLIKCGLVFFREVEIYTVPGLPKDVWLRCRGLRLKQEYLLDTRDYGKHACGRYTKTEAVFQVSHFLHAYLTEVFGLAVDTPYIDEEGYCVFLICA